MMMRILNVCTGLLIVTLSGIQIASAEQLTIKPQITELLKISNMTEHENLVFSAAQPTANQLTLLSKSNIKHVINLRAPDELSWDEGELVESLGITYHALPIHGVEDITFEKAQILTRLLSSLKGEPVLVHCASGNRVGALISLSAYQQGENLEAAIVKGKRWGLKSLEFVVRDVLNKKEKALQ